MTRGKLILYLLLAAGLLAACRQDETTATIEHTTAQPPAEHAGSPVPAATVEEQPAPSEAGGPAAVQFPPATVINDEGGPVSVSGLVTYTNPRFTKGVAEPLVILEDQAGFIDRNQAFLMPLASQTLGQITSDFFTSPFSYSLSLPIEPQGTWRDVDQDGEEDPGLQVFAVAYWTNIFGDPFLEERDLSGGGWSTAYASTRVSDDADTEREVVGGKFLVYAADDRQGFPAGFGSDGLLFTEDDPLVALPQGYTLVNMDDDPFTFDRSRHPTVDLIEPESVALVDYSALTYSEAFDGLVDQLRREYAFTELKGIDWDELHRRFRPRFEEADANGDALAYRRALRDFSWAIPDGHISGPHVAEDFIKAISGGLGIALGETDQGRVIVTFLTPGSPADEAGVALGAEVLSLGGKPIQQAVAAAQSFDAPFSTEHYRRLEQLRYVTRFPLDTEVEISWRNPEGQQEQSAILTAGAEQRSFNFSSLNSSIDGFELPLEYAYLEDSGLGYVQIYSFSDNELLTIQLWERLMRELNEEDVPGLVIDMRQNLGGNSFLTDQMAAYFFQEPLVLGSKGFYDDDRQEFYFDPRSEQRYYLPAEELRYDGDIAVIIGPSCQSACEFFSYDLTLSDRATIIGHYPTAGLGGSIDQVLMPEEEFFTFTKGRAVDPQGQIHIEGQGVRPTVDVPVTEQTLLGDGDILLATAIGQLTESLSGNVVDGGLVEKGQTVRDSLEAGSRVRYTLALSEGDLLYLALESDAFEPVIGLYDETGIPLGNTTGGEALVEDLPVPFDLVLLVEVSAGDDRGGAYTLLIGDGR